MDVDFTPTLEGYTGQSKLRFWCQKVLPLVYDDSLSYYEVLNKVVVYLNNTIEDVGACEDNIVALRDAFVQLQDYVNEVLDTFAPEVERVIDEMIDSGEFGEILADVVNGLIANEYDDTTPYVQFAYCLKDGKLYCATGSTTGTWDETKWRETTVGNDLQLISRRLYSLNAGQISYNSEGTYEDNTVGKELQDLKNSDLNTFLSADTTWEQGSISGAGVDVQNPTRIRTKNYIPVSNADSVSGIINTGYMYGLTWYDSNKVFASESGWLYDNTKHEKPTNAAFVRVVLAHRDGTEIAPSESSNIEVQLNMTVKSAIDVINNKAKYDIYEEGIYVYNNPILAAYTTGSGNYIDFFMPIKVNPNLNLTVTYEQSYRHEGDTGDSHTVAFLPDVKIDSTVGMNSNISLVKRSESGLTFEIGFTTTQEHDKPATIVIARLVITAAQ